MRVDFLCKNHHEGWTKFFSYPEYATRRFIRCRAIWEWTTSHSCTLPIHCLIKTTLTSPPSTPVIKVTMGWGNTRQFLDRRNKIVDRRTGKAFVFKWEGWLGEANKFSTTTISSKSFALFLPMKVSKFHWREIPAAACAPGKRKIKTVWRTCRPNRTF